MQEQYFLNLIDDQNHIELEKYFVDDSHLKLNLISIKKKVKRLADDGNAVAQNIMGVIYNIYREDNYYENANNKYLGNYQKGFYYYILSAKQGYIYGCLNVFLSYHNDEQCAKSQRKYMIKMIQLDIPLNYVKKYMKNIFKDMLETPQFVNLVKQRLNDGKDISYFDELDQDVLNKIKKQFEIDQLQKKYDELQRKYDQLIGHLREAV
jgi:TPR repeat protein